MKWYCTILLLMPDHLHAIFVFPQNIQMSKQIRSFKSYIARASSIQWQNGFFDHRMRENELLQNQYDYIMQNPVRAGLCNHPNQCHYVWKPKR